MSCELAQKLGIKMNAIKLKTDSLHWRFASVYGSRHFNPYSNCPVDLCTYSKFVAVGIAHWLMVLFTCVVVLGVIPSPTVGWIAAMCTMHQWIAPEFTAVLAPSLICCVGLACAVFAGVPALYTLIRDRVQSNNENVDQPVNGWLYWYRSFKNKTCVKIKFDLIR